VKTDVGIESECRQLITKAAEKFGRIDALINNAGKSAQALFSEVADLGWYQELMRINFWGSVWYTCGAALPEAITRAYRCGFLAGRTHRRAGSYRLQRQ
jgi:NAD(P)-dependent dehydrogenase (short-subunit alcohol dehydrogenase family)